MYRGKTIGIVVPAYNEQGLVGEVIRTLPEFVDRIYAVDDCSTDGTWQEIKQAAEDVNSQTRSAGADKLHADGGQPFHRKVVTVRHSENRGVGGAIKTGYKHARDDGIDATVVVGGDGQMDPSILDRIIDPVVEGHADYAKGDRLSRSDLRDDMSGWRLFGNIVLTFMTRTVSGYWQMTDPQNGYTAISAHALNAINIDELYDDYGFSNDLLIALNVHNLRITDVEMEAKYGEETSHIRYSRFIPRLSALLIRRALWRFKTKYIVTDFHPLVFLHVVGALGVAGVLVYACWALATASATALGGLLALLTLVVGSLSISLAMVFDRIDNKPLEVDTSDTINEQ